MKINRIIALLLVGVLILSSFVSCSASPEKMLEGADKVLDKNAYSIEIDVDYRCNSDVISGIFEQLERTDTTVYSKNGSLKAVKDMSVAYDGIDNRFVDIYTVVDGIIYHEMDYETDGLPRQSKNKALIDGEKTKEIFGNIAIIGNVTAYDFSDVGASRYDGDTVLTCRKPSEDAVITFERYLASVLALESSSSNSVRVTDLEMKVEIDGKKYDTVTVLCEYALLLGGKTYTVGMTVDMEFEYGDYFEISTPEDAEKYNDVNIELIF